jgi:hypothetical protein
VAPGWFTDRAFAETECEPKAIVLIKNSAASTIEVIFLIVFSFPPIQAFPKSRIEHRMFSQWACQLVFALRLRELERGIAII